jgi:hypothetical protein
MSNVVQFSSFGARPKSHQNEAPLVLAAEDKTPREIRRELRANSPAATVTGGNQRLRLKRRDVWWKAEAATRYWRATMEFDDACETAQRHGIQDSFAFTPDDRLISVRKWREALVNQLLTPAPDARAVTWKRQMFAQGQHEHIGAKPERIERIIAEDVAWLAAHPVRQSMPVNGS